MRDPESKYEFYLKGPKFFFWGLVLVRGGWSAKMGSGWQSDWSQTFVLTFFLLVGFG